MLTNGFLHLPWLQFNEPFFDPMFYGACFGLLIYLICTGLLRAIVMLPATCAHELAHLVIAACFVASPSNMSLEPKRVRGGWQHGSVSFHATQFNGAFIALAPLFLLPSLAVAIGWWAQDTHAWWNRLCVGYVIGTLIIGAWPSREDWCIAARYPGGFVALITGLIIYHLYF